MNCWWLVRNASRFKYSVYSVIVCQFQWCVWMHKRHTVDCISWISISESQSILKNDGAVNGDAPILKTSLGAWPGCPNFQVQPANKKREKSVFFLSFCYVEGINKSIAYMSLLIILACWTIHTMQRQPKRKN